MGDTTKGARRTLVAAASALVAFLVTWTALPSAWAEPPRLAAEVIWVHAGQAYVAAHDSLPLEEGDLLTFSSGKKVVAAGVVASIQDHVLAVARLTSGSLDRVKKLDRLTVAAERPPLRPLPVLRVGFPTRSSLLFKCEGWSVTAPAPVRDSSGTRSDLWPDSLQVHLFDDSTDEEIALERGELDVAVFWPGEGSTAMRDGSKGRALLYGSRSHGILAVLPPRTERGAALSNSDSSSAAALNEIAFRGDLAPLDPRTGRIASDRLPAAARGDARRFEVDHSCPGWQTIERLVNSGRASDPGNEPLPLTVTCPGEEPKYIDRDTGRILFSIRCPIVCAPGLRSYVRALGPDTIVDMVHCGGKSSP